jgi:hypothetical protein
MGSEQIASRFTRRSFLQASVAGAAAASLPGSAWRGPCRLVLAAVSGGCSLSWTPRSRAMAA